jgi:hypothetical protein
MRIEKKTSYKTIAKSNTATEIISHILGKKLTKPIKDYVRIYTHTKRKR